MKSLLIAIGNSLRRDDGVAAAVAARVKGVELKVVHQLTPEMADDIKDFEVVIFVDADLAVKKIMVERLDVAVFEQPLTHAMSPASVVVISRRLFGFTGQAYLCRVPGRDFSAGEGLSWVAQQYARKAAALCSQ